jgi:hypothetical protein
MVRLGGFETVRCHVLVALPLALVLAVTATAAYAGLVSRIEDSRITESSGLALSITHPGYAYTFNDDDGDDDGDDAIVYTIRISTGAIVGTTRLTGVMAYDPVAISIDRMGYLWLADVGEDERDKDWDNRPPTLYRFKEPTSVSGTPSASWTAYPIAYPDDKHWDVESLFINPQTNAKFLVTKDKDKGKLLSLPSLVEGESNLAKVKRELFNDVSDGSFTPNGKWAVVRNSKKAIVYYTKTVWRAHASFDLPEMENPESLGFDPKGNRFLVGSEGVNSPLYWIAFDQSHGDKPKS